MVTGFVELIIVSWLNCGLFDGLHLDRELEIDDMDSLMALNFIWRSLPFY